MDTSNSSDGSVADFVIGRGSPARYPTPAEWATIISAVTTGLHGHSKYYGLRQLKEDEGQGIDRLVARDIPDLDGRRLRLIHIETFTTAFYLSETHEWLVAEANVGGTRILWSEWVPSADLARVFENYSPRLPERLLDGLFQLVKSRLEEAEQRIAIFRSAYNWLKPIVDRVEMLPYPE